MVHIRLYEYTWVHVHEQSTTRLLDEMKEHKYIHQLNTPLGTMNNVKCASQISSSHKTQARLLC